MALTLEQARARIDGILGSYSRALGATGNSVLPAAVTAGKTYEAWVLCSVLERLMIDERYNVTLVESREIRLKSAPGPINRDFCHFLLSQRGSVAAEVWTDIEFLTFSAVSRGVVSDTADRCDVHELDVVMVTPGLTGHPDHEEIRIGVECKNTRFSKEMLRAILGVRRELSLVTDDLPTGFRKWPRRNVPALPSSCLLAYSTDRRITEFTPPGQTFGIDFRHLALP